MWVGMKQMNDETLEIIGYGFTALMVFNALIVGIPLLFGVSIVGIGAVIYLKWRKDND